MGKIVLKYLTLLVLSFFIFSIPMGKTNFFNQIDSKVSPFTSIVFESIGDLFSTGARKTKKLATKLFKTEIPNSDQQLTSNLSRGEARKSIKTGSAHSDDDEKIEVNERREYSNEEKELVERAEHY